MRSAAKEARGSMIATMARMRKLMTICMAYEMKAMTSPTCMSPAETDCETEPHDRDRDRIHQKHHERQP